MRTLVIAGTGDAKNIIAQLHQAGDQVFATVTTEYGEELLETIGRIGIIRGKLDLGGMEELMVKNCIDFVVDASHPFAREASINAMQACANVKVGYLRYERPSFFGNEGKVMRVGDFSEAAKACETIRGNILLTIGSNHLRTFTKTIPDFKSRLFARVLPNSKMLAKCEEAGLTADNIIAMKGPFSIEMNLATLKHCNASVLVTKESGDVGGTGEKMKAARQLGIPVILVERPQISYGTMVQSIEEILTFRRNL